MSFCSDVSLGRPSPSGGVGVEGRLFERRRIATVGADRRAGIDADDRRDVDEKDRIDSMDRNGVGGDPRRWRECRRWPMSCGWFDVGSAAGRKKRSRLGDEMPWSRSMRHMMARGRSPKRGFRTTPVFVS